MAPMPLETPLPILGSQAVIIIPKIKKLKAKTNECFSIKETIFLKYVFKPLGQSLSLSLSATILVIIFIIYNSIDTNILIALDIRSNEFINELFDHANIENLIRSHSPRLAGFVIRCFILLNDYIRKLVFLSRGNEPVAY